MSRSAETADFRGSGGNSPGVAIHERDVTLVSYEARSPMSSELLSLSGMAIGVGFLHCVAGPDHYLPFVAMSRVGLWSLRKTLLVTVICGIGHVLGSALLGFIGVAIGLIVYQIEADQTGGVRDHLMGAETWRGDLTGGLIVVFGAVYLVWGIVHAVRMRRLRAKSNDELLDETEERVESLASKAGKLTPWVLFTVFVFGPCEPLIPMILGPAAAANVWSAVWVILLFGVTTLVTMTVLVALIYLGTFAIRFQKAEIYGHALAGLVVLACGLAIMFGL